MKHGLLPCILMAASLAGCGTYSTTSVKAPPGGAAVAKGPAAKLPADIIVTENDITDRHYKALGDVSATVRKVTIFDKDPTHEQLNVALQEKAAKMGADAVVLVRYGTVGIGFTSWGVLDGNGRAVVFDK